MDKELLEYTFNDIVERYLERLTDSRLFFRAKVDNVKNSFNEEDEKFFSNGKFTSTKESFEIIYMINPKDEKLFIEYVIAHEIGHLVFWNGNISFADFCKSDSTYAITNIKRDAEEGIYGEALEEILADFMAITIVHDLNPETSLESIVEMVKEVNPDSHFAKGSWEITKKILEMFKGTDPNEPFDFVVELNGYAQPRNVLLYEACIGNMGSMIEEYDEKMGKCAWKRLNIQLDEYLMNNCTKENLKKIYNEIDFYMSR